MGADEQTRLGHNGARVRQSRKSALLDLSLFDFRLVRGMESARASYAGDPERFRDRELSAAKRFQKDYFGQAPKPGRRGDLPRQSDPYAIYAAVTAMFAVIGLSNNRDHGEHERQLQSRRCPARQCTRCNREKPGSSPGDNPQLAPATEMDLVESPRKHVPRLP